MDDTQLNGRCQKEVWKSIAMKSGFNNWTATWRKQMKVLSSNKIRDVEEWSISFQHGGRGKAEARQFSNQITTDWPRLLEEIWIELGLCWQVIHQPIRPIHCISNDPINTVTQLPNDKQSCL